jgi:hypothetical protein
LRKDERVIAKEVREASEMSHQNIRNGPWSGRELQVREETHQYRNLGKESIRKWVLEAAVLANNCWDPQQFMYIYIYIYAGCNVFCLLLFGEGFRVSCSWRKVLRSIGFGTGFRVYWFWNRI